MAELIIEDVSQSRRSNFPWKLASLGKRLSYSPRVSIICRIFDIGAIFRNGYSIFTIVDKRMQSAKSTRSGALSGWGQKFTNEVRQICAAKGCKLSNWLCLEGTRSHQLKEADDEEKSALVERMDFFVYRTGTWFIFIKIIFPSLWHKHIERGEKSIYGGQRWDYVRKIAPQNSNKIFTRLVKIFQTINLWVPAQFV